MEASTIDKNSIVKIIEDWEYLINETPSFEDRLDWLVGNIAVIAGQMVEKGDICYNVLSQKELELDNEVAASCHAVTFVWADQAKMFLLFLRDSLFEQQKAAIFYKDSILQKNQIKTLWEETLVLAKEALQAIKEIVLTNSDKEKALKQLQHQENPWLIYKAQIILLVDQANLLNDDYQKLKTIQEVLYATELIVKDTIDTCLSDLDTNNNKIDTVINLITTVDTKPSYKLTSIHEIMDKMKNVVYISAFKQQLESLLKPYDIKLSPVVRIHGGILERRVFLPYKNILQWFESEIYPLLYEVWEITEQGTTGLRMILLNMTNRLDILQKERPEDLFKDHINMVKPLHTFQKDLVMLGDNITNLVHLIDNRVQEELRISNLFDTQSHFLSVSLQSTLNQKIWNNESGWLAQAQRWLKTILDKFNALKDKFYQGQQLSVSEKITLCIQSRMADPNNKHYTNIFLTKGYVGESFIVGREENIKRFGDLVTNWKQGFRGSVLLTGDRFSGKSVFGEIVARKFFMQNYYSLIPNSTLTIDGRKMQTSYDLKEALDFVCKHSINKKTMLWIDDIEVWWSNKIPFYQNIHHLMNCIDAYSNRIFFVVATNSQARKQITNYSNAKRIFQAEIDLNYLSKEAMQQAIMVRHGATQKKLIDAKGDILTPPAFNKLVLKIYKASAGNVGEALLHWANSTYYIDENTVQHRPDTYKGLPSFLNEDSTLILDLLLLHKRANEYLIRQLLGASAFEKRYATVIRRLINVGILKRQLDGFIEIETTIVNDLKQMLK
ncbi:ATP-binding protein [Aureispira sp. CCB-QB1]|uniref:ATP-binding protein n=1 Tax=Aureispira sp. CCB-QB1 TaxID=1313421 RepID=UPI0006962411|nr:ATP-binding protein [Aureispira sp. CCB-QB1]